ncbi:MAG: hypothetical protein ACJARY_001164 [Candidatus Azotimanducaceae bacterium]|jgi:hypothetical protein
MRVLMRDNGRQLGQHRRNGGKTLQPRPARAAKHQADHMGETPVILLVAGKRGWAGTTKLWFGLPVCTKYFAGMSFASTRRCANNNAPGI